MALVVADHPSKRNYAYPENQRKSSRQLCPAWNNGRSIQLRGVVIDAAMKHQTVHAEKNQERHLDPEIWIDVILVGFRAGQQQAAADHDEKSDPLPDAKSSDYFRYREAVQRPTQEPEVGHQDHAAKERDAG